MPLTRLQIVSFVLVVTAVYGSLHAYLWWKTVRQLRIPWPGGLALALVLAAMVALPFVGRAMRDGSPLFAAVELAAFLWMGAAFYLFALNLAADGWNLAAWLARRAAPGLGLPSLGGQRLFWGIAAATALVLAWSSAEAWAIRLRRVTVPTTKLHAGQAPLRIAQISDLHLGMLVGERRLRRALDLVREADPDLLVATGDVLDAVGDHLDPLAAMLREVRPRLGAYAVTGNHEIYSGLPQALAFLDTAGFRVLRDETAVLPGALNVVGRDYRPARGPGGGRSAPRPLADLVAEGDPALFTLLLKHLPSGFDEEAAPLGVDLQLSGHTHDGQLWPFRWLVRLSFPVTAGPHRSGSSLLYVSRGTGTWGPPLRFLAPPEVTLITLEPAAR